MAAQVAVALLVGFMLGLIQSLLVGWKARSWDGGTGCLWGLLVSLPAGASAVWLGWWAIGVALLLTLTAYSMAAHRIHREGQNSKERSVPHSRDQG